MGVFGASDEAIFLNSLLRCSLAARVAMEAARCVSLSASMCGGHGMKLKVGVDMYVLTWVC
jgi:hypothetical protein